MDLNEAVKKNGLGQHEAVAMIWQTVMGTLDSNKREDLIQDQVCDEINVSESSDNNIGFVIVGSEAFKTIHSSVRCIYQLHEE